MEKRESSTQPRRAVRAFLAGAAVTLAACEPQAARTEKITLEYVEEYQLGNSSVSVMKEKGLQLDHSPFSSVNIHQAVDKAITFADKARMLSVRIGKESENLDLAVTLSATANQLHGFVIVENENAVAALTKKDSPAVTEINLDNNTRVTYLTFLPAEVQTKFKFNNGRLDPNVYNLSVESCNNFLDVATDPTVDNYLRNQKVPENRHESFKLVFKQLATDAVCNSYALATSAKQAGISYEEYQGVAGQNQLGDTASFGMRIPYLVFSKDLWETL